MKKLLKRIFKIKERNIAEFKKSYSQDGEDMLISAFFDDMGGRPNGFFVDIGALHPFRFSNTAHFYERGWRGINIEPTPDAMDLFEKHRTRDINLNIGIGESYSELSFYCFYEPALNSFSKELSEERHHTTQYKIKEVKQIAIYPLAEVLDKYLPENQHIDFMTIDVEGLDLQVLKSNNWDKYQPDFIFAEDIIPFSQITSSEVYKFLINKGYELVAKTHRTMLFRRN
ncbi:FkbM family methyltransferase [Pedobacter nanyangensis]|uniref:FkbM family methyltransferase n=1 Tax=Pedobacter nanyangensis TaxID=1562389 RepID=UPI000DE40274|nr:FkbM family methyltransferase [Pedobacter nanyangensis]